MNFYTFFKSETKKDCKFYNLEHPEFPISLSFYRNNLLRRLGIPDLDITHFQQACYRVIPSDFPKSFYENFFDKLFCSKFRNLVLIDEYEKITDYALRLSSEIDSILEEN